MKIARYLDDAILKPEMTENEVQEAIQQGINNEVKTVCVRPCDIALAVKMCTGTKTNVICVLDFPHGVSGLEAKKCLAEVYCKQGVTEIDMVMNYGFARSGKWDAVEREIAAVVEIAHTYNVNVKVIFETSQLTIEQIKKATEICIEAKADFVKTSTGFYGEGATEEAVEAMLSAAQGKIKVKPSGGIRDYSRAKMFIDKGANRIGCGFNSLTKIVTGE